LPILLSSGAEIQHIPTVCWNCHHNRSVGPKVEVDGTPCGFAFCLTDSLHVLLSCAFLLTFYFIPFYRVDDTLFTQCGPQNINQVQMGFVQRVCLENLVFYLSFCQ